MPGYPVSARELLLTDHRGIHNIIMPHVEEENVLLGTVSLMGNISGYIQPADLLIDKPVLQHSFSSLFRIANVILDTQTSLPCWLLIAISHTWVFLPM